MVLQQGRIGSNPDLIQYDDVDYSTAMEVDDPIRVNAAPVDPADVLRLADIPDAATLVTAAAVITDHAVVRGDGGGRGVQGSGTILDDLDNMSVNSVLVRGLLALVTAGAIEYANNRAYLTNVATRRAIDRTSDVVVTTVQVFDTILETVIFTGTIAAGALRIGNVLKLHISGSVSNASAADDITIRIYLGITLLATYKPAVGNVANDPWHVYSVLTIRTIAIAGSVARHTHIEINGSQSVEDGLSVVDTTVASNYTVTVEWDNAKPTNVIEMHQGFMEFKN